MRDWVELLMRWIEGAGIAVITVGLIFATVAFFSALYLRRGSFDELYVGYRRRIGQTILLGLELLVAADIIGTVAVEPTLRSVGVLGLIVLVRTFLSMALEVEMEGTPPVATRGPRLTCSAHVPTACGLRAPRTPGIPAGTCHVLHPL